VHQRPHALTATHTRTHTNSRRPSHESSTEEETTRPQTAGSKQASTLDSIKSAYTKLQLELECRFIRRAPETGSRRAPHGRDPLHLAALGCARLNAGPRTISHSWNGRIGSIGLNAGRQPLRPVVQGIVRVSPAAQTRRSNVLLPPRRDPLGLFKSMPRTIRRPGPPAPHCGSAR